MSYDRTRVMGILNLTPDSFFDGGRYHGRGAEARAFEMVDAGADIIDIGGESTRPGFMPVPESEEIARIIPFIRDVAPSLSVPLSVDTMKPAVAAEALAAGAAVINDVGGLRDEGMIKTIVENGAAVIIMHAPSDIVTVHDAEMSGDPMSEIRSFLHKAAGNAVSNGIKKNHIIIDPGIGFGKTAEQNWAIIRNVRRLCGEYPVMIGASRKRFLAHAYPSLSSDDASIEAAVSAAGNGVSMVRVHDVAGTVRRLQDRK